MTEKEKILVIKLGALGDFIQAAGPFKAIRIHHKSENITLLTSAKFADFANASPWFDKIKIDPRPKTMEVKKWLSLRSWIRGAGFSRIYDLQTSDRSNFYYKIIHPFSKLNPKPDWSGIASGCSHPHNNPQRNSMHTIERQKEQLKFAEKNYNNPNLSCSFLSIAHINTPVGFNKYLAIFKRLFINESHLLWRYASFSSTKL